MNPRLLIVESDRELRAWLRHHVEILWPDGTALEMDASELEKAYARQSSARNLDLVLLGVGCGESACEMPSAGLDPLRRLLRFEEVPPIVVIASGGNELTAVQAMRMGAADYLPRRLLNAQRLASTLRVALRQRQRALAIARTPRRALDALQLALPQYSIVRRLGESARAAVYLAHSAVLGRYVALKVTKPTATGPEEGREFAREYAAISAIRHPAVVEIYDYGYHAGREFIAMEYFPCGDLKTRLMQPITIAESLQYAQRICAALTVIHGAGLVHRDLKPPNVMLRQDGSIVLIDFGLARGIETDGQSTAAGVLRGSPYYMSPEQAQGLPPDARSDLYSVGVILFEMLSGNKPYSGSSAVEVIQQHVRGVRPPLPPECRALEPLLDGFMAQDLNARFPDAAAATRALLMAAGSLPSGIAPLDAAVGMP